MALETRNKIASICARDHVTLTANGSMAIYTALKALDLPPQSGVMMPSICCPAVLSAIQLAGHKPIIGDIDLVTFSTERKQAELAYTSNCSVVIAVHAYGRPCGISSLHQFCLDKGIILIEDACLAYGNSIEDRPIGSFGDISILSFGYDKPLSIGSGGSVMTDNEKIAARMNSLVTQNPILSMPLETQKLLDEQLPLLPQYVRTRIANSKRYYTQITAKNINCPEPTWGYWRLPILAKKNRDKIVKAAAKNDVIITTHYRSLSGFATQATTPNANKIDQQIMNLFVRAETSIAEIEHTISFLNEHADD